jgi:nucleoside-diphosphate-sugar epimerase
MAYRLVLTGASGYIGTRLVERALKRGCEVVVLGSAPRGLRTTTLPWRLGEPLSPAALAGASALIHLGHSWKSDDEMSVSDDNLNLRGGVALARACLDAGLPRFVFASTTSARANALNAYGRIKYRIEEQLLALPRAAGRLASARIALVYGGADQSLYGLLSKLVSLTPVLPMIGLGRELQPIHVDEVCDGLLELALDAPQEGATFVLAGTPITFGQWLKTLRRTRLGKGLVLIPLPMTLALLACDLTSLVPFGPTISRERVYGLAGAAPMASAADLDALGLQLRDPVFALLETTTARRRLIAEAATLLTYVAGRPPSIGPVIRLTRGLARDQASLVALPWIARRCPGVLRLFEPLRPSMRHGLSRRLHLAAMVAEVEHGAARRAGISTVVSEMLLDLTTVPFRLLLAPLYA